FEVTLIRPRPFGSRQGCEAVRQNERVRHLDFQILVSAQHQKTAVGSAKIAARIRTVTAVLRAEAFEVTQNLVLQIIKASRPSALSMWDNCRPRSGQAAKMHEVQSIALGKAQQIFLGWVNRQLSLQGHQAV